MSAMDSNLLEPHRIDFDASPDNKDRESIPVYLRIKPTDSDELSIKVMDNTTVETNLAGRANKKATFTHIFSGNVGQQEVFDVTTAPLVERFLDGANVMSFAYGVTSSGKTYTILGDHSNPGILPRTLEKIFGSYRSKIEKSILLYKPIYFEAVQELKSKEIDDLEKAKSSILLKLKGAPVRFDQYTFSDQTQDLASGGLSTGSFSLPLSGFCSVWISAYEIYNEVVTDLLVINQRNKRKALTIGQDGKGRTFVKDLFQLPVSSAADAYALLQVARQNLAKAATKLNDTSSRSHMVFTIKMIHWGGTLDEPLVNQFVISDLAGSERQAKTGASGVVLRQASAINGSLLVLGRCLESLRRKDKGIAAPFRDSKLTRILNPFFTLGGFVSLIICINPVNLLADETMDTIRFSAIASEIVQAPEQPLERLRQLRRLTQGCAENSPIKFSGGTESGVECWQDAVHRRTVRAGVAFLEVRASYFKDMARDILRAEKMLARDAEEILRLKQRVKNADEALENTRYMYQDLMKAQREKFLKEKSELQEAYDDDKQSAVEDLEYELEAYKTKYLKYKEGYVKVTDYMKDRLCPELSAFRERFGFLPEFPSKDGANDSEHVQARSENTIDFWRDKLQESENEVQSLRKLLAESTERQLGQANEIKELSNVRDIAEAETAMVRLRLTAVTEERDQLEQQLRSVQERLDDQEALLNQVESLRDTLRQAEEGREVLIVEHELRVNILTEELDNIKAELRERQSELEQARTDFEEAKQDAAKLTEKTEFLEHQILAQDCSQEERYKQQADQIEQLNKEKLSLSEQLATAERELGVARQQVDASYKEMLSMQERIDEYEKRAAALDDREEQLVVRMRELHVSRADEASTAAAVDEAQSLRERLDEERTAHAEKTVVVQAQAAELEELRERAAALEVVAGQLERISEENRELRDNLRNTENERRRLFEEVQKTRALQVEVEFLTHRLENQKRRVLAECPQTERPIRTYRRSRSHSELSSDPGKPAYGESAASRTRRRQQHDQQNNATSPRFSAMTPCVTPAPASATSRRRLWLGNEENQMFDEPLNGTIRDVSPLPTPNRLRNTRRR